MTGNRNLCRPSAHLNRVNMDILAMVEEFAIAECGGEPDDIIVKPGGIYSIVYGSMYNYDREEIDVKFINGEIVVI